MIKRSRYYPVSVQRATGGEIVADNIVLNGLLRVIRTGVIPSM